MTGPQVLAITHHCRLAFETAHPRFAYLVAGGRASIVLTCNTGWRTARARRVGGCLPRANRCLRRRQGRTTDQRGIVGRGE